jgi:ribosomal protein S18 acetylase RimI-like enzyme
VASADRSAVELPVQRQLEAYNARDIDGFMRCWAEDCEYYEFPARLLARGAAEVRERHLARFKEPGLFGKLLSRISVGNVVVDHETVTRTFPDGPGEVDVVAIYEVAGGRIAKAWFKQGAPRLHPRGTLSMRTAGARDAGAVRALVRQAYGKWVPVFGHELLPMNADYDAAVRANRIDLLSVDEELAALIEMMPEPEHLLILSVAVAPPFQGRGFGRKLLAHAEQVAAAWGRSAVRLYTNRLCAENVALYRKVGYTIDREEPCADGSTVYMSKRL